MTTMIRGIIENIAGLWELLTLAARSGFQMRNSYWKWRRETAFGDFRVGRFDRFRAILDYGKWVHRMKKNTKRRSS